MDRTNWQTEKEALREKALEEHARLHRLFVEDRLSFERERKRMIDEVINSARDESQKKRLRSMQDSWDKRMKGAGSLHNRFVLAQTFFWEHFHEQWQPAIQEFNHLLNDGKGAKQS